MTLAAAYYTPPGVSEALVQGLDRKIKTATFVIGQGHVEERSRSYKTVFAVRFTLIGTRPSRVTRCSSLTLTKRQGARDLMRKHCNLP